MKRIAPLLFFYCILAVKVSAQQPLDTHHPNIEIAKQDTNEIKRLNILARQVLELGNYSKADSLAENAMLLAKELNFSRGQASAYFNLGSIFFSLGRDPEALKNFLAALKIDEQLNNKRAMASDYGDIGLVYYQQGDTQGALKNYNIALKEEEEVKDTVGIITAYVNIGTLYNDHSNYTEALKNQLQGLKLSKEDNNVRSMGSAYIVIGITYCSMESYADALKNTLLGLNIARQLRNKYFMSYAYMNMANILVGEKEYAKANMYFDSGLVISKAIRSLIALKSMYESKALLDSTTGNYKAAFNDNKLSVLYRDSLKNEEYTKNMVREQMNYEFEKKEAAEKAEQEKAEIIKTADRKRKSIIVYGVIILFVLAATLIISMLQIRRKKEKAIMALEKRRVEEELANAQMALNEYTHSMVEKNELLDKFKTDIEGLKILKSKEIDEARVDQIESLNKTSILTDGDWDKFKGLFEQVHKGYLIRLKEKMPDLTQAETRLICLTKLKLDGKHMASALGISPQTVIVTRYRLRKKLGLSEQDSIDDIAEAI